MATHGTWQIDEKTGDKIAAVNPRAKQEPKKPSKPKAKEK